MAKYFSSYKMFFFGTLLQNVLVLVQIPTLVWSSSGLQTSQPDGPLPRSFPPRNAAATPPPPATIPAHPPPTESATNTSPEQQKQQPQSPPPPPPPSSGVESEAPPKRRRLEEVGFQRSPYYTIRETVANLRGRFLQVCQGTDSQKNAASVEILKEMKSLMELSKKTRLGLSAAAESVEPFDKPAAIAPEEKPAGKVASAEQNQVPLTSLAGNSMQNTGGDVPLKPDDSDAAAHSLLVELKRRSRSSKATGVTHTNQHGLPQGSYVIGGSPIGWNFLMWPGSKAVYYGLTKAEWLARRSAK